MTVPRRLLVPLDGSAGSRTALPAARRVAALAGAQILVLHVAERAVDPHELAVRLGLTPGGAQPAELLQSAGRPAAEIVRVAGERRVWLVVMSSGGERAWSAPAFGSVAADVIQESACAVFVLRPDMAEAKRELRGLRRVLLPLDGSPGAAAAVAPAADLARRAGARLDLLHVATIGQAGPAEPGTLVGPRYLDAPQHEWPGWAQEFLRRFGPAPGQAEPAVVRLYAARGGAADEILRHARELDSDLVAIAWHRTLAPGRAAVVKRLLAETVCPLLFVPTARGA